jgi:hypothetical protein
MSVIPRLLISYIITITITSTSLSTTPNKPQSSSLPQTKLISRLINRAAPSSIKGGKISPSVATDDDADTAANSLSAADEIAALDRAFNSDPSMQLLFQAKLDDWMALKEQGALDALR